ncbi:MAG: dihydrofolate reductase family protein [Nanoarchaeota archaeon]|nr:dihydrofolate reductase family protein [Nanoarchaeota archaeon]
MYRAYAAVTLDGKIAKHARHFSDWTSREDKEIFRKELAKADVIIVGMNTYKTAKKPLSGRNCIVLTRQVKNTKCEKPNICFCNPKGKHPKDIIKEKGYKHIAVIGGAKIYDWALKEGMMDELHLTIEPVVFGKGISLFSEPTGEKIFELRSVKKLNKKGSLYAVYRVK